MRLIILSLLVLYCSSTVADDEDEWQHGVSIFDEFKYGPDFEHFEYANPDAPKGGTLVLPTTLDFTSFTPFLPRAMYCNGGARSGDAIRRAICAGK